MIIETGELKEEAGSRKASEISAHQPVRISSKPLPVKPATLRRESARIMMEAFYPRHVCSKPLASKPRAAHTAEDAQKFLAIADELFAPPRLRHYRFGASSLPGKLPLKSAGHGDGKSASSY